MRARVIFRGQLIHQLRTTFLRVKRTSFPIFYKNVAASVETEQKISCISETFFSNYSSPSSNVHFYNGATKEADGLMAQEKLKSTSLHLTKLKI